jgi:lipoprotein-anchoring transpeptidase ErfK/SrfK
MLKSLILASATAVAMMASPALAANDGIATEAAALAPNTFVWADTATAAAALDPVSVIISIADQRAYVYRGESLIAATSVSTGKDGKETPVGTYPILQKKEQHRSNLYDASMPYMQRLTWDGIALHAGRNPGFPASHGCIRLPSAFAKKLFAITELGTTVTVVDESVDPSSPPPPTFPEFDSQAVEQANTVQLTSVAYRQRR